MCGAQALGEERERVALQARRGAGDIQASARGREVAHNETLECRGAARAVLGRDARHGCALLGGTTLGDDMCHLSGHAKVHSDSGIIELTGNVKEALGKGCI